MKKILLASSALVLTTGFAWAQDSGITIGGDGYFGAALGDDLFETTASDPDRDDPDTTSYVFVYDLDFDFNAVGETDGGLAFGASADADEVDTSQGIFGFDSEIFISGGFGRLAMGDTDGGAEAIIGDLAGVGLTGLGDFNENVFLLAADEAPAGPLALYQFDSGPLSLALGLSDDEGYSVGAAFEGGIYSVGIAYESVQEGAVIEFFDSDFLDVDGEPITVVSDDDVDHIIGAATVNFNNVAVKGSYGYADAGEAELDQYGISAEGDVGVVAVSAYYRRIELELEDDDVDAYFTGVGAEYDLGGGASVVGGLVYTDVDDFDDKVIADFGLAFSF